MLWSSHKSSFPSRVLIWKGCVVKIELYPPTPEMRRTVVQRGGWLPGMQGKRAWLGPGLPNSQVRLTEGTQSQDQQEWARWTPSPPVNRDFGSK